MTQAEPPRTAPNLIEVKVNEVHQLFNSMDPSPFHERDLDHDAEQFIVSWAQECSRHRPVKLVVHLATRPAGGADAEALITEAFAHYFSYRADMILRDFKHLMKEGRTSLIIGLLFLVSCHLFARLFAPGPETWHGIAREGLTIMGWVAMWRPLEIYLYRWWPLLHLKRLYEKLAAAEVEVRMSS